MSKFRDGLLGPPIILCAICLLITFALAGVYDMTKDTIAQVEAQAADDARKEVLPEADSFTQVDATMPEGVSGIYRADNGAGFVITSQAKGFGGPVVYMVAMNPQGDIVGIQMFSHEETPGLGTKIGDAAYLQNYYGNVDVDQVAAVSGATRTSNSLKNSLKQARDAYELVKGA